MPRQLRLDMVRYADDLVAPRSRAGSDPGDSNHLPVMAWLVWRAEPRSALVR